MMSDLYYKKKLEVPWISLIFSCTFIWVVTIIDKNLFYKLSFSFISPKCQYR